MATRTCRNSQTLQNVLLLICILCALCGICNGFSETDGKIEWDPFPTEPDYQAGRLHLHKTFKDINKAAVAFIHAIPPTELPWELYRGIINGTVDFTDPLLFVDHTVGFMAMFAIAIIFIIFVPITGIIFCCCRCCDRCGAHMLHREEDNVPCKRAGFAIGILITSLLITVGIGISFIANQNITTGIREVEPSIETNMEDLVMYINQTVDEIEFLLEQVDNVKGLAVENLDDISQQVGVPVRNALAVELDPAIYAVRELHKDAQDTHNLLNKTSHILHDLQFMALVLAHSLDQEKDRLNETLQSDACSRSDGCRAAKDLIYLDRLALSTFYNQTNIEEMLLHATDALQANLTELADQSQATLDSLPQRIADEGYMHIEDIKDMVDDLYAGRASDIVDSARAMSDDIAEKIVDVFSPYSAQPASQAMYDGIHMAVIYDQYRFYAGIGAVCVFIVILLCNYLGILFGECGRDKRDHPTERGCLSNLGGTLLLAGVAFAFLFSGLLMLLTTSFFLAGGGVEKAVCNPLETKAFLREIVDYPHLLAHKEPSFLGAFFLGDGSQEVSGERMISKCEQNSAIMNTLDTNLTVTIAEILLNYSKDSFAIESVDLSNFTTIEEEVETALLEIRSASNKINVSDTLDEIKQAITKVDLDDFAVVLRTTADSVTNTTLKEKLETHSLTLNTLRYTFVLPMQGKVNKLAKKLISLQNQTHYLSERINSTLDLVYKAEDFVHKDGPGVLEEEINSFRDRLVGFLEQTADYIIYELTTDLGHCRPLANVYSSLDVVLCDFTSDSLNSLWFTLGGCVILLIPSIIFAVKLSKFYRRMKFFEDIYGENDLDTLPMKAYGYQTLVGELSQCQGSSGLLSSRNDPPSMDVTIESAA